MLSERFFLVIEALPELLSCVLYVLLFVLISDVGLMLYNAWSKKWNKEPQGGEMAGLIFGALSLIYSLILAFVIVAVWTNYDDLGETIEKETDKLNNILAHSETLPNSIRQPLVKALFSYCHQVTDKEWRMQEPDVPQRPSAIPALRMMLLRLEPQNSLQQHIYDVVDEDLSCVSDLRRARLDHTRSHVPDLIWLILKAGSAMLMLFSYFLNAASEKFKRVYVFFLSTIVGMSLFLVYTLDRPYTGCAQVSNQPYQPVIIELKQHWMAVSK